MSAGYSRLQGSDNAYANSLASDAYSINSQGCGNTNFARLTCVLMELGTARIRQAVLDHLHPCHSSLQVALNASRKRFDNLLKQNKIRQNQHALLYPEEGGPCNMDNIDMSLWFAIARNITVDYKKINWTDTPKWSETSWQYDVIRVKTLRNSLFHLRSARLSDRAFEDHMDDLSQALVRLGASSDEINEYKSRDLDRETTMRYQMALVEQEMEEIRQMAQITARDRRHLGGLTLLVSVIFVTLAIGIPLMVVYLRPHKPCSKHLIQISGNAGSLNFMPRSGWGALPALRTDIEPLIHLNLPVSLAGIMHTAVVQTDCSVTEDCCEVVRRVQKAHMSRGWQDIAYNFVIASDGVVYEGRGATIEGAAIKHRNPNVISIAFLGNYMCESPGRTGLMALYVLLDQLAHPENKNLTPRAALTSDYDLYGHCQLNIVSPVHNVTFPDSPGAGVMKEIMFWKHWRSDNKTACEIKKDCLMSSLCCTPCNSSIFD